MNAHLANPRHHWHVHLLLAATYLSLSACLVAPLVGGSGSGPGDASAVSSSQAAGTASRPVGSSAASLRSSSVAVLPSSATGQSAPPPSSMGCGAGSDLTGCGAWSCMDGGRVFVAAPAGTEAARALAGDCRQERCDGDGGVLRSVDLADVPDSGWPCAHYTCATGVPTLRAVDAGSVCGDGGQCFGLVCVACNPGSERCQSNVEQVCPDGSGWTTVSVCSAGCGQGPHCACPPGESRCRAHATVSCLPDGGEAVRLCKAGCVGQGTCDRFQSLAVTASESCALTQAGRVWCWGCPDRQQDEGDCPRLNPPDIIPLPVPVSSLNGGYRHLCALDADGGVWCWGRNLSGEVNGVSSTDWFSPARAVRVPLPPQRLLLEGLHRSTCAYADDGLMCWGLRLPYVESSCVAEAPLCRVTGAPPLAGLASASKASQGLCTGGRDGGVFCWGRGALAGVPVSSAPDASFPQPQRVAGLPTASWQVSMGSETVCAVGDGQLWCWGAASHFRADGDYVAPVIVNLPARALKVSSAWRHTCVLLVDGTVWCAGRDWPNVSMTDDPRVDFVLRGFSADGGRAIDLASGWVNTCVLMDDRESVECWGSRQSGVLGAVTDTPAGFISFSLVPP